LQGDGGFEREGDLREGAAGGGAKSSQDVEASGSGADDEGRGRSKEGEAASGVVGGERVKRGGWTHGAIIRKARDCRSSVADFVQATMRLRKDRFVLCPPRFEWGWITGRGDEG
jgi:hypothetical protein